MVDGDLRWRLLECACERLLGEATPGSMAFIRCLAPEVVRELGAESSFAPTGWDVWRVADRDDPATRTITADEAVERREAKRTATLLLVDSVLAGAGMDGIYSAALEIQEAGLFGEAHRLAAAQVRKRHSTDDRRYAERALALRRGHGGTHAVSQWASFDFLCQIAAGERRPGGFLHLIGLWPVQDGGDSDWQQDLLWSRLFVDRLLGPGSGRMTPAERVQSLNLDDGSQGKAEALQGLLHAADIQPLLEALRTVAGREDLWIGALRPRPPAKSLRDIRLNPWRNKNGSIAKWSGLTDMEDEPPALRLNPKAALSVKWKAVPAVAKNAVDYRVAILTDMEEEIATKIVAHRANKGGEQCRFSEDDFSSLSEDSVVPAKVSVSVVDNHEVEAQESEEFTIRFGQALERPAASVARIVRTFSEGISQVRDRAAAAELALNLLGTPDAKDFLVFRTPLEGPRRSSFKVYRPPLVRETEAIWVAEGGPLCRWTIKVRESGAWEGPPEFVPFDVEESQVAERAKAASQKLAARFQDAGGVGQVYDDQAGFDIPREYLLASAALMDVGDPLLALMHTVEVQSLSGRTIGIIVLPAHPLRVAWLAAYDNLVLHTAFELGQGPKEIEREFAALDSAMFPAFLPNPSGGAFVFADTLGFHAVGMVPDTDKEPKAAVSTLAKALGNAGSTEAAPTVGKDSAKVLGNEIDKYIDCHNDVGLLHVHALRAGDGFTIARSLGNVYERRSQEGDEEGDAPETAPAFCLNLYPSREQRGGAGRFITQVREKRRSGAGTIDAEDRWMLESLSLPGGVNMPRLRWARKEPPAEGLAVPETAAHLAIAFDTFESQVVADANAPEDEHPYHAFGLMAFYERRYESLPHPLWQSTVPIPRAGERHPSGRGHSKRLAQMQDVVQRTVARHVGGANCAATIKASVTEEKAENINTLHQLCDWVVTLDRNAGIEYFDSPRSNKEVYDTYVIDCVPERDDLGCLQLITSTANLDEVRGRLDGALDHMGLSRSRHNAEFLLEHLKALSGRLAIRLTGQKPATSALIALAVVYANCRSAASSDDCWTSLQDGFFIPIDDVQDLLAPLNSERSSPTRPDLIFVSKARTGLTFEFVEVKYRRDLRAARSPEVIRQIHQQIQGLRKGWEEWYGHEVCAPFRAIRRAKLARVLRFYADRAKRHFLPPERYEELVREIRKMVVEGGNYVFGDPQGRDRGWVFCPEFAPRNPLPISDDVFLVGPSMMPDALASAAIVDDQADHLSFERDDEGYDTSCSATGSSSTDPRAAEPSSAQPGLAVSLGTDVLAGGHVDWSMSVKGNPHLLIAGLPRMGKTTCLVNMCRQMAAIGVRPIVFSYHQDLDEGIQSLGSVRFLEFDGEVAESPAFRRFLEILQSEPKRDQGLRGLLARLEELDDYGLFSSAMDQPSLWDSEQPVVVRIHTAQNDILQRGFASLVFYRLYKDMFHRGIQERITHAVVFDEAHRAARLKLLPTMAKECRKYGVSLVVASQEASDFDTSLFSAIANYLVFRLTDADARFLVRNVASSHQEKALLDRIKEMDRFRAMFFREGERRARTLALHSDEDGRVATAIKYYQTGTVSTGAAAELAGIPKPLLLMKLGDYGIDTFDMSEDELDRELDSARRIQ